MNRFVNYRASRRQVGATQSAAAAQPWDALLICTAALVLISMARVHDLIPGIGALRPGLVLAYVSLVVYLTDSAPSRALHHLKNPLSLLALFFLFWAALGAPFGLYPGQSVRFIVGDFAHVAIFVVLVAACVRNIHDIRRLLMALAVGAMIFSLFAALPASFRMVSGGGYDANDSAMFVAAAFPLVLHFLIRERRPTLKLVFALALVICTVAIVRTGSRGGFLAFVAVILYTVFFSRGVKPMFRLITVAAVAGVMALAATGEYWDQIGSMNDPDDYNQTDPSGRKAIWQRARGYMLENPVLGVGIQNFRVAEEYNPEIMENIAQGRGFKFSAPHSIWYQVGVETGFPGLAAFMGLFGLSILYLRRLTRYADSQVPALREAAGLSGALIGSLLAVIVAGTFLSNAYWAMVWGLFGLVIGLLKVMRFHGIDITGQQPAARAAARTAQSRPPMRVPQQGRQPRPSGPRLLGGSL